ncbi:WRKY family transcription factor [Tanacetum coccineum]
MMGETPPPKQPIDKAYSIASIKACIPTPLDLDKPNYNSWSSLFHRFCKTYEVHHHLDTPPTTITSTADPLHDLNDSLVVMWIYSTISPKLVEMIVDVDSTAHGVWKRLKDLFHNNKDARITQLDNEIRNMAIGSSSITDFFQQIKSKADRLANLDSPVKDSSLVTYAINGIRSKYLEAARVVRLQEKAPTFDELRSLTLLEESDMSQTSNGNSLFHNTSSSPTILIASTTNTDKANTMSTSGIELCHNFQRGTCTYGARSKLFHGHNDLRPPPTTARTGSTNKTTWGSFSSNTRSSQPLNNNQRGVQESKSKESNVVNKSQYPNVFPAQQLIGSPYAQQGSSLFFPGNFAYTVPSPALSEATMPSQDFQTMTLQEPNWNKDTRASSHLAENTGKNKNTDRFMEKLWARLYGDAKAEETRKKQEDYEGITGREIAQERMIIKKDKEDPKDEEDQWYA